MEEFEALWSKHHLGIHKLPSTPTLKQRSHSDSSLNKTAQKQEKQGVQLEIMPDKQQDEIAAQKKKLKIEIQSILTAQSEPENTPSVCEEAISPLVQEPLITEIEVEQVAPAARPTPVSVEPQREEETGSVWLSTVTCVLRCPGSKNQKQNQKNTGIIYGRITYPHLY